MDVEKTIEFLLEQQARFDARQAQFEENAARGAERHEREMAAIRAQISRGVRLAVEESRRERKRRKDEDERLAALHALTEQKLQRLIDSLNQPHNGHDKS